MEQTQSVPPEQHAHVSAQASLPAPGELLGRSWKEFRARIKEFLLLTFVPMAVIGLVSTLILASVGTAGKMVWGFLLFFITLAVSILTQAGAIFAAANPPGSQTPMQYVHMAIPHVRRYFMTSVVFVFALTIGFVLLIIPGFYVMVRYGFAPFISLLEGVSWKEAFKRSSKYTEGKLWPIFGRWVAMFLVMVAIGIGTGIVAGILFGTAFNEDNQRLAGSILQELFYGWFVMYAYLLYQAVKR